MTEGWLVAGLGNPGDRYAGTRHNVGELAIRRLAGHEGVALRANRKARSDLAPIRVGTASVLLAVPHSFMNESGGPVAAALGYHSIAADHLVVIHDEIDLPFAALRVKFGGGDNGHNGLRSIRRSLGTGDFYRIRVGVGRGRGDAADHVLARFSRAEQADLPELLDRVAACADSLVTRGLAATQNEFND